MDNLKYKSDSNFKNQGVQTNFNNDIMNRFIFTNNKIKDNIDNTSVKKFTIDDKILLSKVMQLNMATNMFDEHMVMAIF